jgi:Protein of unknown function (DUF2846)
MKKIVLLLLSFLLVACATEGLPFTPAPPPPEGKALVYLMRTHIEQGGIYQSVFYINDSAVVALLDKGYTWVYLTPGLHKFSAGANSKPGNAHLFLPIEAGKEYYIDYNQIPGAFLIKLHDTASGKSLIAADAYVEVK